MILKKEITILIIFFSFNIFSENLISDYSFEKSGWELFKQEETSKVEISEEAKHSGEKGLLLKPEKNGHCFVQMKDFINILPNKKYRFVGWYNTEIKPEENGSCSLFIIYWFDKEGKYLSAEYIRINENTDKNWKFCNRVFKSPENSYKSKIKITGDKGGIFKIDDVYFGGISDGKELIENGGFENLIVGIPDGWYFEKYLKGSFNIELDTENPHSGKNSIKIDVFSNKDPGEIVTNPYGEDFFPIEPDTSYTLKFWVKGKNVESIGEKVNIRIVLSPEPKWGLPLGDEEGKMAVRVFIPEFSGDFDWQEVKYSFITKPWQKWCQIHFQLRFTKGTIWYDDISLEKIGNVKFEF